MNQNSTPDDLVKTILQKTRTIAMVGASANEERPSYKVLKYLLSKGYIVWPINPGHADKDILGQTVYASLSDLPETPDMVDIFRNSDAAADVVHEILLQERLPKTIWMQLGVEHEDAARQARAAGIQVIMNRCPKIEYERLGL